LKSRATSTIHPMLQAGAVFYATAMPIGISEEQGEQLNALGYDEIQQEASPIMEFDADGNWTGDAQTLHTQRDLSMSLYNPFDTELTYALSIVAAQEMVFYRKDLAFNPLGGAVPEPGTWAMMGLGLVGIAASARVRSRRTMAS
jgi:PEP-CTERM motif